MRGRRRERKRRKRKHTVREKEKVKSSFKWQAHRNARHSALPYVNVCSFSQLPICQFAIHSYQTLSKALLLCSPRHQNEASTLSIWLSKDRLSFGAATCLIKPVQGTYCNRSLEEARSQYDLIQGCF